MAGAFSSAFSVAFDIRRGAGTLTPHRVDIALYHRPIVARVHSHRADLATVTSYSPTGLNINASHTAARIEVST